ncbi:hypothetical protein IIA15_05220 [candidate division TA06 bacterium]|nr:hypothetical protein [candidate division TA06 bacterium]
MKNGVKRKRSLLCLSGFLLLLGCGKAEGPILYIDREALSGVKKIALLPITNVTPYQEINPLLDQIFTDEMLKTKGYSITTMEQVREAMESLNLSQEKVSNPMDAKALGEKLGVDGVMGLMIIAYTPTMSEIAELKTETDVKAHTYGETKEELKKKHGVLWGFLVDILIPDVQVKAGVEHKYGTVTTDPTIGIGATMVDTRSGQVIYQASKYIKRDARLPGAYKKQYKDIITKERFQLLNYIARLSIREVVQPLKTVKKS